MTIDEERLLERFLRYVRVETTAREGQKQYPSSPGQLELGRMVAAELEAIGLADVVQSAHGIVTATLPPTGPKRCPTVALSAHFDTSPETSGANVKPHVFRGYAGGDIALPNGLSIPEDEQLAACKGDTIVTTDGSTLLGADDKAGVAVIVETMAYLIENPGIAHGRVRVCFTCDEEIGHGVDHIDLRQLAANVCYTLDGQDANEIDVETFSADLATVTIRGINIHPSIAKGRMVNALRVAGHFIERLDMLRSPETTEGREGFLHPYQISGGVGEVTMRILLRDFDSSQLVRQLELLHHEAREVMRVSPHSSFDIQVTPQYRNMAEGLAREPRSVAYAVEALDRLGRKARLTAVRGGTDGSRLTELGLPTPNLSTGQHNIHSPLEWASLAQMRGACDMLVSLLWLWYDRG